MVVHVSDATVEEAVVCKWANICLLIVPVPVHCFSLTFTASGRSLMWHKNSSGPRTVPCGTPESTVTESDSSPSTTTFIFLFVKKSNSQELILPSTP